MRGPDPILMGPGLFCALRDYLACFPVLDRWNLPLVTVFAMTCRSSCVSPAAIRSITEASAMFSSSASTPRPRALACRCSCSFTSAAICLIRSIFFILLSQQKLSGLNHVADGGLASEGAPGLDQCLVAGHFSRPGFSPPAADYIGQFGHC